jgi:hypothetical protein
MEQNCRWPRALSLIYNANRLNFRCNRRAERSSESADSATSGLYQKGHQVVSAMTTNIYEMLQEHPKHLCGSDHRQMKQVFSQAVDLACLYVSVGFCGAVIAA